jgi:hypothetical protein
MTTTVAIAAQYASGNPTNRPSNIEIVAAAVVRKACDSDGRFSFFQLHSFINQSSLLPVCLGKVTIFISKEVVANNSYVALKNPTLAQ